MFGELSASQKHLSTKHLDLEKAMSPDYHDILKTCGFRVEAEIERFHYAMAIRIQCLFRMFRAKLLLRRRKFAKQVRDRVDVGIIIFQSVCRGAKVRKIVLEIHRQRNALSRACSLAIKIQSLYRRYVARRKFYYMIRSASALVLQRCFRGHRAREVRSVEERRMREVCISNFASTKIQSYWRRKVCREEFLRLKWYASAAVVIQKVFRGRLGRRHFRRLLRWRKAMSPNPSQSLKSLFNTSTSSTPSFNRSTAEVDRLKLGIELVEVLNKDFRRLREEIVAVQTALDKVLRRLSVTDTKLKACERLCGSLLFESASLRRIDRHIALRGSKSDLRSSILRRVTPSHGSEARSRSHDPSFDATAKPQRLNSSSNTELLDQLFPLPLAYDSSSIQERNQGNINQELINIPSRFLVSSLDRAAVISEGQREKLIQELHRLSFIADTLQSAYVKLECTLSRKLIELQRLFDESTKLLRFQSQLIVAARKVYQIRLEESSVTTMEEAILSASAFDLYEKKVQSLFIETESMIDFQFITSSVSFSSKASKFRVYKSFPASKTKTFDNIRALAGNREAEEALNMQIWTVDDVSEWLVRIGAEEAVALFRRAAVDGGCLVALRPDDLINIIGVSRASVAKSIISARDSYKNGYISSSTKQAASIPDMPSFESIFTQISAGRVKRVETSLNSGFPINLSDPTGTTLLMMACRSKQRRIVEILVTRGADVNMQNEVGNTALHFCFLERESDHISDFLIAHGADDSIKNFEDLTAYEVGLLQKQ